MDTNENVASYTGGYYISELDTFLPMGHIANLFTDEIENVEENSDMYESEPISDMVYDILLDIFQFFNPFTTTEEDDEVLK